MKNYLLSAILLLSFSSVFAQSIDEPLTSNYKPTTGNSSFEINFDPSKIFASSDLDGQFNLLDGAVKYRKFTSEYSALRMAVNLSYSRYAELTSTNPDLYYKVNSFAVLIKAGKEKHFTGTKRLSPYIGWQGVLGYGRTIEENETSETTTIKIINGIANDSQFINGLYVGFDAVAGFDYYIAEGLYLGLEISYGIAYIKEGKYEYENSSSPSNNYTSEGGSYITARPDLSSVNLRLGWNF